MFFLTINRRRQKFPSLARVVCAKKNKIYKISLIYVPGRNAQERPDDGSIMAAS